VQSFQNIFKIIQNFMIPESQNLYASTFQSPASLVIICLLLLSVVATAVQLDRQLRIVAVKVQNKSVERMLATELHTAETSVAQQMPKNLLCIGEFCAQVSGIDKDVGWDCQVGSPSSAPTGAPSPPRRRETYKQIDLPRAKTMNGP